MVTHNLNYYLQRRVRQQGLSAPQRQTQTSVGRNFRRPFASPAPAVLGSGDETSGNGRRRGSGRDGDASFRPAQVEGAPELQSRGVDRWGGWVRDPLAWWRARESQERRGIHQNVEGRKSGGGVTEISDRDFFGNRLEDLSFTSIKNIPSWYLM